MNILITGAWGSYEDSLENIKSMGHEVVFMQNEVDALPCDYSWVQGIICNGLFLSHPIEKFVNLKYIQLTSSGFDRVHMDYVNSHDIKIYNAHGVYSIPMAEFAICGVLDLYKKMKTFHSNQAQHVWAKNRGLMELYGKNVLIVGGGSVGTECAKRFEAFGCSVVICGRDGKVEDMVSDADIIVLAVPLLDETRHMINSKILDSMKPGAIIVNVSRGAIIDEDALIYSLRNGNIGGAVLDVFEEEPLNENSSLWDMENVIITPHNSFVGEGNSRRLSEVILRNLECWN